MSDSRGPHTRAVNLPHPLSTLVGRDRDLAEVSGLLARCRLVTLSGPGGCGKTRLAIAVATEAAAGAFGGGVWWVELGPVADPAGAGQAIAAVFGVRERPGRALVETLCDRLRSSRLLMVLDNCEHLIEECASLVSTLLAACAELRIMSTSREPLGINGERTWPVLPLAVPDPKNLPPTRSLPSYDGVRLFAERVAAVEPGFRLTDGNARAVALVCHRLDGIPLAIELTAARARMLAIEEIAVRLEKSFDLVTGGSRGALPQQRTLWATMDWSHALLTAREATLFRRLAVFRGGFTAAAVDAVCGGDDVEPLQVFDLLTRLVDKSLVLVTKHGGAARYRMLETVRQYAREKLDEAGDGQSVSRCHAEYFLVFAEGIEPRINTADRLRLLAHLDVEGDNLRAALRWSHAMHAWDTHARLAAALLWWWFFRGYLNEGRGWLAGALEQAPDPHDRRFRTAIAKVLGGAGLFAWFHADYPTAGGHLREAIALWRELADPRGLAQNLRFLSAVAESEVDYPLARTLIEESVRLCRSSADAFNLATSLAKLGNLAVLQEDYDTAWNALDESISVSRRVGDMWILALGLRLLGLAGLRQGDHRRAIAWLTESLVLLGVQGDRFLSSQCVETLAAVYAAIGEHRRAAQLFGVAEMLRDDLALSVIYPEDYERGVALARAGLGQRLFESAWAEGKAMSPQAGIDLAMAPAASAAAAAAGLTARETDVLRLVARGMTNDEVAKQLYISPRTVNWHLTSIYAKLGLRSRTEATRYSADHGLF